MLRKIRVQQFLNDLNVIYEIQEVIQVYIFADKNQLALFKLADILKYIQWLKISFKHPKKHESRTPRRI